MRKIVNTVLAPLALLIGMLAAVTVASVSADTVAAPPAEAAHNATCSGTKYDKYHSRFTTTDYHWAIWYGHGAGVYEGKVLNHESMFYRACRTPTGHWLIKPLFSKYCHQHYRATGRLPEDTQSPYLLNITYDSDFWDNDDFFQWHGHVAPPDSSGQGRTMCTNVAKIPYPEREWYAYDEFAAYQTALTIHQQIMSDHSDYIRNSNGLGSEVAYWKPMDDPTINTYPPGVAEPTTDPVMPASWGSITTPQPTYTPPFYSFSTCESNPQICDFPVCTMEACPDNWGLAVPPPPPGNNPCNDPLTAEVEYDVEPATVGCQTWNYGPPGNGNG